MVNIAVIHLILFYLVKWLKICWAQKIVYIFFHLKYKFCSLLDCRPGRLRHSPSTPVQIHPLWKAILVYSRSADWTLKEIRTTDLVKTTNRSARLHVCFTFNYNCCGIEIVCCVQAFPCLNEEGWSMSVSFVLSIENNPSLQWQAEGMTYLSDSLAELALPD
jgi:hypothetical protein